MYSVKISFIDSSEFNLLTKRWWIDQPRKGPISVENNVIIFSGWIICTDPSLKVMVISEKSDGLRSELPLNVRRVDALNSVLGVDDGSTCGFNIKLELEMGITRLGFNIDGKIHKVLELSVSRMIKVIKGKADYLFLDNDTNRSVDQFTGNFSLPVNVVESWNFYLKSVCEIFSTHKTLACLLIAPAKEEVFTEFYPHARGAITPIDDFMSKVRTELPILFPLDILRKDRELTYSRIDSHWTDFGAAIAAEQVLDFFDLSCHIGSLPKAFEARSTSGDLGIKTSPPTFGRVLKATQQYPEVPETFNNRVNNNGRIRVYENTNAPVKDTLVMFGDSFSTNLARLINTVFSRVVYSYTGAGVDRTIMSFERPKYVVVQSNQRFIVSPPPLHYDIWNNVRSKLIQLDKNALNKLAGEMETQIDGTSSIYASTMLIIISAVLSNVQDN